MKIHKTALLLAFLSACSPGDSPLGAEQEPPPADPAQPSAQAPEDAESFGKRPNVPLIRLEEVRSQRRSKRGIQAEREGEQQKHLPLVPVAMVIELQRSPNVLLPRDRAKRALKLAILCVEQRPHRARAIVQRAVEVK